MDPVRLELLSTHAKKIERDVRLLKRMVAEAIEENDDLQSEEAQDHEQTEQD